MIDKKIILDNIELYSAKELVTYIKDDIISFDELCTQTNGFFSHEKRLEIKKLIESSETRTEKEERDWEIARSQKSIDKLKEFLESYSDNKHRNEARELIIELEKKRRSEYNEIWTSVNKDSIEDLQDFIKNFPYDEHCEKAKEIINELQQKIFFGFGIEALIARINAIQTEGKKYQDKDTIITDLIIDYVNRKEISINDLLLAIEKDNNLLKSSVLYKLINENGYFSYNDLEALGIDQKFIHCLTQNKQTQIFAPTKKIDKINRLSTEVYFWGIPSSGKSCALGALLSVANNGKVVRSMIKDNDCQGYGYMTRLAQLFKLNGEAGILPEGTSIYSTYEMGFDLEDDNKKLHPITCIDFAGELIRCMYKSDANEELNTDEKEALDTLTNILIDNRTKSRKIHFFVIEYNGEIRNYEGLSQTSYLDAAFRYIDKEDILKKDTDAIYIMITKVDKAMAKGQDLQNILKDYIKENYWSFYNGLERICRNYEINNGNVEILPFSLGKVCFQDYCIFSDQATTYVLRKILSSSKGFRNTIIQKILNWFTK